MAGRNIKLRNGFIKGMVFVKAGICFGIRKKER